MKVGFLGLGQMGRGMALRLLARGHEVTVWNRTAAASQSLKERGARVAGSPEETLRTEVVITMLGDDTAVDAVWLESGLIDAMSTDVVHLNMATVSLRMAQRMVTAHRERKLRYVAAPVFGRPFAAAAGELDIIVAGPSNAAAVCQPLFEALGKRCFDLGTDPVHAHIVKIARNFLLGTIIESLGEAFALVRKSGVDATRFLDIITSTSMSAPAYKSYGRLMLEPPSEATFTLKLGMKDVELALDAGADTGVPMLMAALLREQHAAAIARGFGDRDWAALGNYIAESAGL